MRGYKTEGIVLKRLNFAETDRILTIFSKHYGKIKAIAKGIRQLKSRRAGSLELFNHIKLSLAEGRNFDIISEVETINSFLRLRKDLRLAAQAFQIAEVLDKLTSEKEANKRLFSLLVSSLQALNQGQLGVVLHFEIELLKQLGFGLPQKRSQASIERYIEKISEKRLASKKIFQG